MCGVYLLDDAVLVSIEGLIREIDERLQGRRFGKDIHPTETAPVIVGSDGGLKLTCQRWGYPGFQKSGVIFNARAEGVQEKKLFAEGIRRHRAAIPAKQFYEWNVRKEKNTFFRGDGQPLFLAGFFDMIENEARFVILTTQANDSMRSVHDRMPLVLEADQLEEWVCEDSSTDRILKQVPVLLERRADYEQMMLF